jgi:hypothetical protein
VLDLGALELDQNDRLLGAEKIGHYADDFEVELFDLVSGKDREGIALHAGADLIQRENLIGIRGGGEGISQAEAPGESEKRGEKEMPNKARPGSMRLGLHHEATMILGRIPGSN